MLLMFLRNFIKIITKTDQGAKHLASQIHVHILIFNEIPTQSALDAHDFIGHSCQHLQKWMQ